MLVLVSSESAGGGKEGAAEVRGQGGSHDETHLVAFLLRSAKGLLRLLSERTGGVRDLVEKSEGENPSQRSATTGLQRARTDPPAGVVESDDMLLGSSGGGVY